MLLGQRPDVPGTGRSTQNRRREANSVRSFRRLSAVALATSVAAFSAATASAAPPTPGQYKHNDFGGFRNVLPPAQGTNANANQIAAYQASCQQPPPGCQSYPPHTSGRQLDVQEPDVRDAGAERREIGNFFKDASFGVSPGNVERTYSPRGDVTIQRDKFGVPHIYGATRAGAMFGAGYVAAEDRLFFIDVLRHAGRAQLSSFAGGANAAMDERSGPTRPTRGGAPAPVRPRRRALRGAGRADPRRRRQLRRRHQPVHRRGLAIRRRSCPASTALIDPPELCLARPGHWKVTDVIATGSLVAGIFGKGGGGELGAALSLEAARQRFGADEGQEVWTDFRVDDPEAPTTVHGTSFPTASRRAAAGRRDARPGDRAVGGSRRVRAASAGAPAPSRGAAPGRRLLEPLREHHGASNALLVSARESECGHPLAVFGPQTGYFVAADPDGAGHPRAGGPRGRAIDARGVAFPGTNLYVQLGRGRDYSWCADLGRPGHHRHVRGEALRARRQPADDRLDALPLRRQVPADRRARARPTLDSRRRRPDPAGLARPCRRCGPSSASSPHRATIDGKPYAYTRLRATYFHEVDSALGFADWNNPDEIADAQDFMQAANKIDLHLQLVLRRRQAHRLLQLRRQPGARPSDVDPNLPRSASNAVPVAELRPGPDTFGHRAARRQHPQVIDQHYLDSWNNRQAPDYHTGYSLALPLTAARRPHQGRRSTAPKKINLAGADQRDGGRRHRDLRGDRVLPWILKVIDTPAGRGRRAAGPRSRS